MSNGAAPLTQNYAMRLRRKIRTRISAAAGRMRVAGLSRDADPLSKQAARLNEPGSAGYPDEEDFPHFAAEAGFSFAIVQDTIPEPTVSGVVIGLSANGSTSLGNQIHGIQLLEGSANTTVYKSAISSNVGNALVMRAPTPGSAIISGHFEVLCPTSSMAREQRFCY